MFHKVMAPVDLAHQDKLENALKVAADIAALYQAELIYVGVTSANPGKLAHTPEEFAQKLAAFAAEQGSRYGIKTAAHAATSHDPAAELDEALMKAVEETGADLVVMQSHIPGLVDHIWPSNGGKIAAHAKTSVMVVRG